MGRDGRRPARALGGTAKTVASGLEAGSGSALADGRYRAALLSVVRGGDRIPPPNRSREHQALPDPTPSEQDITTTAAILRAAKIVHIPVVDHVIVPGQPLRYHSMLDRGTLPSAD